MCSAYIEYIIIRVCYNISLDCRERKTSVYKTIYNHILKCADKYLLYYWEIYSFPKYIIMIIHSYRD